MTEAAGGRCFFSKSDCDAEQRVELGLALCWEERDKLWPRAAGNFGNFSTAVMNFVLLFDNPWRSSGPQSPEIFEITCVELTKKKTSTPPPLSRIARIFFVQIKID